MAAPVKPDLPPTPLTTPDAGAEVTAVFPVHVFLAHAIDYYMRLAVGCPVHKTYRAIRAPRKACTWCTALWAMRTQEDHVALRTVGILKRALDEDWSAERLHEELNDVE